ncbi:tetratricopeptide repeat protein [Geomonas azotofigens]|uniref:tetratricopeptide repeat protein n=1 Tax=Geomonas azotofigens TaxID=2843196 RepID=UPI001C0FD40A|nr:tetratricopeptide repeat protein [Geomonas azotofigens]MBU5614709.1 hypothetical protein [Geomonas azotofigens]
MVDDLAKKRIEKLLDKGIDHLEAGRYTEALQVAAELEYAKNPFACYLAGQSYAGLNDVKSAVDTMRRGVLKTPTLWTNWLFLGICLSRLNRHEEASAAYDQALLCPHVKTDEVRINMALLGLDRHDYEAALTCLDGIEDASMRWCAESTRILALEGMGRIAEAGELAERFLEEHPERDDEYQKRVGFVVAALARIRQQQGCSKDEVQSFLMHCLDEYGSSNPLLGEIRRLKGFCYSDESKRYQFIIVARLPAGHPWYREARGYYVAYDVVSDSESRALEMINEFESVAGVESVEVADVRIREDKPEGPMGIYWVTERVFG